MSAPGPVLAQLEALRSGDVHREHEVVAPEAGGPDDAVELVERAVGTDDALGHDARERLGDELHFGLFERLAEVLRPVNEPGAAAGKNNLAPA